MALERAKVKWLSDQLVGVRLLALEMTERVEGVRQLVLAGKKDDVLAALKDLDELVEPMHKAGVRS